MASFLERYAAKLVDVLSCFDRMVMTGTIPGWRHAEGMTRYLSGQGIRVFDYAKQFAEPLRDEIVATAERLAQEHGLTIEFIRTSGAFRPFDNTFLHMANLERAQELADVFPVERLHRALDVFACRYCPVIRHVSDGYHWSLMQVKYAPDLIFKRRTDWQPLGHQHRPRPIHPHHPPRSTLPVAPRLPESGALLKRQLWTAVRSAALAMHTGYAIRYGR